jgi:hypothetical protein
MRPRFETGAPERIRWYGIPQQDAATRAKKIIILKAKSNLIKNDCLRSIAWKQNW